MEDVFVSSFISISGEIYLILYRDNNYVIQKYVNQSLGKSMPMLFSESRSGLISFSVHNKEIIVTNGLLEPKKSIITDSKIIWLKWHPRIAHLLCYLCENGQLCLFDNLSGVEYKYTSFFKVPEDFTAKIVSAFLDEYYCIWSSFSNGDICSIELPFSSKKKKQALPIVWSFSSEPTEHDEHAKDILTFEIKNVSFLAAIFHKNLKIYLIDKEGSLKSLHFVEEISLPDHNIIENVMFCGNQGLLMFSETSIFQCSVSSAVNIVTFLNNDTDRLEISKSKFEQIRIPNYEIYKIENITCPPLLLIRSDQSLHSIHIPINTHDTIYSISHQTNHLVYSFNSFLPEFNLKCLKKFDGSCFRDKTLFSSEKLDTVEEFMNYVNRFRIEQIYPLIKVVEANNIFFDYCEKLCSNPLAASVCQFESRNLTEIKNMLQNMQQNFNNLKINDIKVPSSIFEIHEYLNDAYNLLNHI